MGYIHFNTPIVKKTYSVTLVTKFPVILLFLCSIFNKNSMKLVLLTMMLLSTISCASGGSGGGGVKNIAPAEAKSMMNNPEIVWIDVRTAGEIKEGFIKGTEVFADYNGGAFEPLLSTLDKNKTYVVYCRSGGRSSSAADLMAKQGFTKVYNLSGGISSWDGEISRP
jgi:phage shock protein E